MNRYERHLSEKKKSLPQSGPGAQMLIEQLDKGVWFRFDLSFHPRADKREFSVRDYSEVTNMYHLNVRGGGIGMANGGAHVVVL